MYQLDESLMKIESRDSPYDHSPFFVFSFLEWCLHGDERLRSPIFHQFIDLLAAYQYGNRL